MSENRKGEAVRGFVRGILWGSLTAAGGLVVAAQLAGPVAPPQTAADAVSLNPSSAPDRAGPVTKPAEGMPLASAADTSSPEPAPAQVPAAEQTAPVQTDPPEQDVAVAAPVGSSDPTAETATPAPGQATPELSADQAVPEAQSEAPQAAELGADLIESPRVPASSDGPSAQPSTAALQPPPAEAPAEPAQASAAPPAPPPSQAPAEDQPTAGPVKVPTPPASGDAPAAVPAPDDLSLPIAEATPPVADLPPPPPLTPEEEALLQPLPDVEAAPADTAPEGAEPRDPTPEPMPPVALAPEAAPEAGTPAPTILRPDSAAQADDGAPDTLAAAPQLSDQADGVVTGRLPAIQSQPAEAAAAETEGAPEPDPVADDSLPPLQRYARAFDNPAGKPLFAILLQDDGQDGVNRADLAALELPISIIIDPLAPGAAERAAIWRAGGQEVIIAGSAIPEGAEPGDIEQSFQALADMLPEAVAVIDPDGARFQNDRQLSAQLVPILAEQGRGLVTFDQGLNAADQVARREGLAAATIFRRIDAEGGDSPVIRRYLDRAAFKAAQEGRVIVIGTLRPETVAGLMEWAVEGRASSVALAPVSAMLAGN